MFMLSIFTLLRRIAEPNLFPLLYFLLQKSLHSGELPLPPLDSKGTSNSLGKKYSIGSSPLISFPSMTITYLLFSITRLAIALLLISPFLLPFSPSLAPERYFRTWVLITYQFYKLSLFLQFFDPTNNFFLQFSESSLR